jgi:hypothetical protein
VLAEPNRMELSLPTSARVAAGLAGVLLVGMLVVLIAVLASLEGTRSELRTTRAAVTDADQRARRASDVLRPYLEAAAPLTEKSSQRRLRRVGRTLTAAAGAVPPLAEDAHNGVGAAVFIAQVLQGRFVPAAERLFAELNRNDRRSLASCDKSLRSRAPSAAGQIDCLLRVVPNVRGLLESQRELNRASLTTQRDTLARTRRIHKLFIRSLAIQRQLLKETQSINRKLPPPVTPPSP